MLGLVASLLAVALLVGALVRRISRLQRAASESEARYTILTDNLAAAVILHKPDGEVVWCSPYTEVLTGYALSEIYASRTSFLTAHVHGDDRDSIRHAFAIVASGEPFQCRYRFYHKSGLCLWLETRTVPVVDRQSDVHEALSIVLDVTASVNAQLKVEERNRDLNEFTYMVSHDLKAPIVTLRGMLELVKEEYAQRAGSAETEPLDHMGKAIKRLESLVQGVLELAQVSTTERELVPIDLNEVISEVVDDFQWQIGQVGARVGVAPGLPWVFGNKTQLYQIFANLLGNALKYRDPLRAPEIEIGAVEATSRRRVSITVRDNGRGIAREFQEAIFKPFSRAGESAIEGSGVGLAAVKRIVEKLGGSIRVESGAGVGSTFSVDLRRAASDRA